MECLGLGSYRRVQPVSVRTGDCLFVSRIRHGEQLNVDSNTAPKYDNHFPFICSLKTLATCSPRPSLSSSQMAPIVQIATRPVNQPQPTINALNPSAVRKHHRRQSSTARGFSILRSLSGRRLAHNKLSFSQWMQLARRLCIFIAAVVYLARSIQATISTTQVLIGYYDKSTVYSPYSSSQIGKYVAAGLTSIRESRLVQELLANDTRQRNGTLYLDTGGSTSFAGCPISTFSPEVYSDTLLREAFLAMMRTTHHHTFLVGMQLVVPVVDCTFTPMASLNPTLARTYYVVRNASDAQDLALISVRFSVQDYYITARHEMGPIGFSSFTFLKNLTQIDTRHYFMGGMGYPHVTPTFHALVNAGISVEGYWQFRTVPADPTTTGVVSLITARRSGVYLNSESQQSNIKNLIWNLETDPMQTLVTWQRVGPTAIKNSWAWVHYIHLVFVVDMLRNLLVLYIVVYRNFRQRRIWIGDAFVSVSKTLHIRGLLVVITWYGEGFWTLFKFGLNLANVVSGLNEFTIRPEIFHAGLLTIYLSVLSITAELLHERMSPSLAVLTFELTFQFRAQLLSFPAAQVQSFTEYAQKDYARSIIGVSASVARATPMRQWTIHELASLPGIASSAAFAPMIHSMILMVLVSIARKLHRRYLNSKSLAKLNPSGSARTVFETATGVELQTRVGVVASYESSKYIKGLKFASADGIYSNGFVIANGRFLVSSGDLPVIVLMKLLRWRFRNVFVFQVDGTHVQERALLVYPQTMTWSDIVRININILS